MQTKHNIGVLGGTFDPIHLGHIQLASEISRQLQIAEIRLIPSYQPVHRMQPIANPSQRVDMVKLAIADANNSALQLDEREIQRGGKSYMIDTLESMRQAIDPNTSLALLLATDAFAEFDKWHRWQDILQIAHLIIANRPGHLPIYNKNLTDYIQKFHAKNEKIIKKIPAGSIIFVDVPTLPISATHIRELIVAGKIDEVKKLLPPSVFAYIDNHKLYKDPII